MAGNILRRRAPARPAAFVLFALMVLSGLVAIVPPAAAGGHPAGPPDTTPCEDRTPTVAGTSGPDELVGTDGPDVIQAGGGNDVIKALGGDDIICAGAGDDAVFAGDGADVAHGGEGDDRMYGGEGDDALDFGPGCAFGRGDGGNDVMVTDAGDDVIEGNNGDDLIITNGGHDKIDAGAGDNRVRSGDGNDVIGAGNGRNDISSGAGNDLVTTGLGADVIDAGDGFDKAVAGLGTDRCIAAEVMVSCEDRPKAAVAYQGRDSSAYGVAATIQADRPIGAADIDIWRDGRAGLPVVAALASSAYDITLTADGAQVGSAQITIPYDAERLGGDDPATLRMFTFDRTVGLWVPVDGPQTVDTATGTVTATSPHLSTFAVFRQLSFERYWQTKPVFCRPPDSTVAGVDVALVIDRSGSMAQNDPQGWRVDGAKQFVAQATDRDRVGVVAFEDTASPLAPLTPLDTAEKRAAVDAAIEATRPPGGGTDITAAVRAGTELLRSGAAANRPRTMVLLTDGESAYDNAATTEAADADVVIYTMGLGPSVNRELLEGIASRTDGRYSPVARAEDLPAIYAALGGDLTDDGTDTDNDGLTDCRERRGMLTSRGMYDFGGPPLEFQPRYLTSDPNKPDTDDDGLPDGDEMGPAHDIAGDARLAPQFDFLVRAGVTQFYNPPSNPSATDTDGDKLSDRDEQALETDAWRDDTDGDGGSDYDEATLAIWGYEGTDPTRHDPNPADIPDIPATTVFVPRVFGEFPPASERLTYDHTSDRCSTGSDRQDFDGPPCSFVVTYSQHLYSERSPSFIEKATCVINPFSLADCVPIDIEGDLIRQAVAEQQIFNHDGKMLGKRTAYELAAACEEAAEFPVAVCSPEDLAKVAEDVASWADIANAIRRFLDKIPGGRRRPTNEVDQTKKRLEDLCRQAKANRPQAPGQSAMSWGTDVHQEFDRLVRAEGNPRLFGETGILNRAVVQRSGAAFPKGTTAPDAILGRAPLEPTAIFDLKTGAASIKSAWTRKLRANLDPLFANVPVIPITC
jgi:hypothetical protein